jgi:hypothetical protein
VGFAYSSSLSATRWIWTMSTSKGHPDVRRSGASNRTFDRIKQGRSNMNSVNPVLQSRREPNLIGRCKLARAAATCSRVVVNGLTAAVVARIAQ